MEETEAFENYSATLRIFGKIEDMSVISSRLGMEPTRIRRRGEPVEGTSERYELDFWEVTAPVTRDRPLEDHFAWLRHRLIPRGYVLRDMLTALSIDLFCEYRSNHGRGGFGLTPRALEWLVALGIGLEVAVMVERQGS